MFVFLGSHSKALKDEKLDPETYEFEIGVAGKTPAKKGKAPTKAEEEAASSAAEEGDLNMADMVVQDECNEDETVSAEEKKEEAPAAKPAVAEEKKEEKVDGA